MDVYELPHGFPSTVFTLIEEDQLLAVFYVIPQYIDKIIPVRTRLFMVETKSMPCKEKNSFRLF